MNRIEFYSNLNKYKDIVEKSNNYLEHQGTKGMKWGVRNWQYPDGRFTPEGKMRYFGTQPKEGVAATTIALSIYASYAALLVGTVTIGPAIHDAKVAKKAKKFEANLATEETDPKTGFKLKNDLMKSKTTKEDMEYVNLDHQYHGTKQKYKDLLEGTDKNCSLCTTAMVLRQKGYDVQANKRYEGTSGDFQEKIYKGGKFEKGSFKDIMNKLESEPEGSYGHFSVVWRGGNGAHSMFYKIEKGKPVIYCTQTNKIQNNKTLMETASPLDEMTKFMRCDNLEVNFDFVKENKLVH